MKYAKNYNVKQIIYPESSEVGRHQWVSRRNQENSDIM
jgi:hypothetical protein